MDEKFYTPLSATGYLTPLQRKKLREKRGLIASLSPESEDVQKSKKSRVVKRKREINASVLPSKREKRAKHKEPISQIQCSVARIISKTNDSVKEKKFFKTSSPSRLEKLNFSMPFVYKKNLFSVIDKNTRENSLHKKKSNFKEHSFNIQPSHSDGCDEYETKMPCIIKINNFSDVAEDSVHMDLIDQMPEQEPAETLFDFDWPSDQMLLKRQEEARASIKKRKVLNENAEENEEQQNIGMLF